MRRLATLLATSVLLSAAGCARGGAGLVGSYRAYDTGLTAIEPPVTLEIARTNRYTFCQASRCVTGGWSAPGGADRITFRGAELEAYVIAVSFTAFGPDEVYHRRGRLGFIELDRGIGALGPQITLGAGDAAFVKQ